MGKRSSFERAPRDFYPTPHGAVLPLLSHLSPATVFIEPCVGDGALVRFLELHNHRCVASSDIEIDARRHEYRLGKATHFITNPPWLRDDLHPIIINLSTQAPTWLLFDADWVHTRQSGALINRLRKIVSVGRVKWIPGSLMTGKDNCAWHLFDRPVHTPLIEFFGRDAA